MFSVLLPALAFGVQRPEYGRQDRGISPKGPSDRLSFETADALLGYPAEYQAVELLFAKEIIITQHILFCLSGAPFEPLYLQSGNTRLKLERACVYEAHEGDTLIIAALKTGGRLYLVTTPADSANASRLGLRRGAYAQWFAPPVSALRLLPGPEAGLVLDAQPMATEWRIGRDSDLMGLRLEGQPIEAERYDIISSSVCDGTVQLTPNGPIVLMRHRQTTGGYPRIAQLFAADIDTLAQYPLGSTVRFVYGECEEAKEALQEREAALERFRAFCR